MSQIPSKRFDGLVPPAPKSGASNHFGAVPPPFATPPVFAPVKKAAATSTILLSQQEPASSGFDALNYFNTSPPQAETALDVPAEQDSHSQSLLQRLMPLTLRETPSWLISLSAHVGIILLLALIPFSEGIKTSLSMLTGMGDSQDIGDEMSVVELPSDSSSSLDANESPTTMPDLSMSELVVPNLSPTLTKSDLLIPTSVSNGLRGRTGPMKDALLKAFGGTGGTEDAVQAGLKWLARNQRSDGAWSLVGPYSEGGVSENKPAATAMALLAFMGAGNTHKTGPYKDNVLKGIGIIKKLQDKDGFFADQAVGNQRTYAQAQCTIAICELYGMTGDADLREIAQKAIRYAEKAQSKSGGWRYQPREGEDTCVTGWYVMALISARMAGLDVDSEVLERVHKFLDAVQRYGRSNKVDPNGERYAYQTYSSSTPSMTAEGMLCRLYLGWNTQDPRIESGAEFLCSQPISTDKGRISYYYWYYASTTLHHIGGSPWKEWNDTMKEVLPAMQITSGKEKGSWPSTGDPNEGGGGRLYATCFSIYCLESYYRHLPLSDMAPKK